jgi:hypothetical protein
MLIELANDIISKFAVNADNIPHSDDSAMQLSNSFFQLPVLAD